MKTSTPARLNFIHGGSFLHPKLVTTLEDIMELLLLPNDDIVMVVGSAGVGKSHLRRELVVRAGRYYSPVPDPRFLPVVGLEVQVFSDSKSHWTAFHADLQRALAHPMPSTKSDLARSNIITSVQLRRTRVIVVDEAHHLLFGCANPERARARSEVIKSLSQKSAAKIVLLGTYALIPLLATSAQLARRNGVVHFKRYRDVSSEDQDGFCRLLGFLDQECEPLLRFSLEEHAAYVYDGCAGLVGQLHNWLENALSIAQRGGD